jgi:hypothetical protein
MGYMQDACPINPHFFKPAETFKKAVILRTGIPFCLKPGKQYSLHSAKEGAALCSLQIILQMPCRL